MLVSTVSHVLEMSDGAVPEAFKGRVKSVYKPVKGTGKTGNPYSFQKLIVTDGANTLEVVFDGRDEIPRTMEGQQVYAVAARGEKGLSGLKRKDNDYNNKITPQLRIYEKADVTFEGTSLQPSPARQEQSSQQQQRSEPAARQPTTDAPTTVPTPDREALRRDEIKGFNRRLARNCSALNRCFDAAFQLSIEVAQRHPAFKPSPSDMKEIATTLFIQTCFNYKVGELDNFPMKTFQSYENEAKEAVDNGTSNTPPQQRRGQPFN